MPRPRHAADGRGGRGVREAVVHRDDEHAVRRSLEQHMALVEALGGHLRQLAVVAAAVDRVKDHLRAHLRQPVGQVRVHRRRAAGVGPHVVADQSAHGDAVKVEHPQRLGRKVVDLPHGGLGDGAAQQRLGVAAQVRPVGQIEAQFVVAQPVRLVFAGAQRQPHARLRRRALHAPQRLLHLRHVKLVRVARQRPLGREQYVRPVSLRIRDAFHDARLVCVDVPRHRDLRQRDRQFHVSILPLHGRAGAPKSAPAACSVF